MGLIPTIVSNWPIIGGLIVIYWILVIIAIVASDRDPATTIAWIAVLVLLPLVGIVIYFFAGRDWKGWLPKQKGFKEWWSIRIPYMKKFYEPYAGFSEKTFEKYEGTPIERIARSIEKDQQAPPLPLWDFQVYPSGEEYFPVLLDDLSKAKDFIHMSYFIWEADELTQKFNDVLIDRKKAGVEIRILNDFMGCLPYKKDQIKELKANGIKVGNDMSQIGRLNYRNHRKITVVDGLVGHSGGFNIGQEYIDGGKAYPAWRDTGIRFEGPLVGEFQKLFSDRWFEVEHESLLQDRYMPRKDLVIPENAIPGQIVAQGVEERWESSRRAHGIAIGSATKRVWLQSPYFVPDAGTYDAVVNAALAGVDVRLMMTEWPDHQTAWRAAESYYRPLLRAGGRIFRWKPGFFHAKTLTVDGIASAIGTMNLDIRSLKLHKELMVWTYDEAIAKRCEEIFEADMENCREITLDEVNEWTASYRFVNSAMRIASNTL